MTLRPKPLLKICGLTAAADACAAHAAGADFLGFVFHHASPRGLTPACYGQMQPDLPPLPRVAVCVAPARRLLEQLLQLGFDHVQVHFDPETALADVSGWAEIVGHKRLWLAPRLLPGEPFREAWLTCAGTFLLDGHDPKRAGGTGRTGDWKMFRRLQEHHGRHSWWLAGGLRPDNLATALAATAATRVDVSSGVESSPGRKDPELMRAFAAVLTGSS